MKLRKVKGLFLFLYCFQENFVDDTMWSSGIKQNKSVNLPFTAFFAYNTTDYFSLICLKHFFMQTYIHLLRQKVNCV